MTDQPGSWGRLVARFHGEVPAGALEAYRRAGGEVYQLLDELEQRRANRELAGKDSWSSSPSAQAALLCGWNAFSLQLLGDQLLQSDYDADPRTTGFVPPVTSHQALAFYGQVPGWLGRARQALASESFQLDVAVPSPLPPWVAAEPCPRPHLAAMRGALAQLRQHADAAEADFHVDLGTDERKRAHDRIHEVLAEAQSAASYADRLWAPEVPRGIHEEIERHAKRAVEAYYLLGQLYAMPAVALQRPEPTGMPGGSAGPPPGQPGFDPWVLTDPATREQWKRDRSAQQAIGTLWANDDDPRRTLSLQGEVDAAVARGDIAYALDRSGRPVGHYFCCPWSPIYEVRRPVVIGGRHLRQMQQFTLDVSAEDVPRGGRFRREVLVGNFNPTNEVDYCIPGRD
ncbi:MAG: hypothetical protein HYX34_08715 [Actinobacteria bacterium]|nr:hypothetical protein [Actinomycetota bacterium]